MHTLKEKDNACHFNRAQVCLERGHEPGPCRCVQVGIRAEAPSELLFDKHKAAQNLVELGTRVLSCNVVFCDYLK